MFRGIIHLLFGRRGEFRVFSTVETVSERGREKRRRRIRRILDWNNFVPAVFNLIRDSICFRFGNFLIRNLN